MRSKEVIASILLGFLFVQLLFLPKLVSHLVGDQQEEVSHSAKLQICKVKRGFRKLQARKALLYALFGRKPNDAERDS